MGFLEGACAFQTVTGCSDLDALKATLRILSESIPREFFGLDGPSMDEVLKRELGKFGIELKEERKEREEDPNLLHLGKTTYSAHKKDCKNYETDRQS